MSMPFIQYGCTACGFGASSAKFWGQYSYRFADKLIPIARDAGWCSDCASLVAIEALPSPARTAAREHALVEKEALLSLEELREAEAGPRSGTVLHRPAMPSDGLFGLRSEVLRLQEGLADERARTLALRQRMSAARCLTCGSDRVKAMTADFHSAVMPTDSSSTVTLNVRHPGCEGWVTARNPGMRFHRRLVQRIYSTEGQLLTEQD